jgi:hypothetical protein
VQLDADAEAGHDELLGIRGTRCADRTRSGHEPVPPVWCYMPRLGSIGASTPRAIESWANVDTSVPL